MAETKDFALIMAGGKGNAFGHFRRMKDQNSL
jgi:hypothetical protein